MAKVLVERFVDVMDDGPVRVGDTLDVSVVLAVNYPLAVAPDPSALC